MPRTHRSAERYTLTPATIKTTDAFSIEAASFSIRTHDFPHSFFAPLHYEPGYAYPLIVWLHGCGGDERQLQRIMPSVSMRNYVAVAPQGIPLPEAGRNRRERYDWLQNEDHILHAEQRVFECVDLAAGKYNISPDRVFLAGFDRGGTMAMRIAMAHARRFAGVISLCGAFPSGPKLFGNLADARRLGILLAAGRDSDRYPAARVCDDLRLIHTSGLSVTLRQYPCGHELSPRMLADLDRWIIEMITSSGESAFQSNVEWTREFE